MTNDFLAAFTVCCHRLAVITRRVPTRLRYDGLLHTPGFGEIRANSASVSRWVDGWVGGSVDGSIGESVGQWVNGSVG